MKPTIMCAYNEVLLQWCDIAVCMLLQSRIHVSRQSSAVIMVDAYRRYGGVMAMMIVKTVQMS